MNNVVKTLAAAAAFALVTGAAFAQTQTATPPPAKKPGILSRLFHPKPKPGTMPMHTGAMPGSTMGAHSYSTTGSHSVMGGRSMMGSHSVTSGQIIGNKNSHVFHMPGDKGSLPSPQNRVYFPSAAAAQAAGYHAAGGSRSMSGTHSMMHSSTMSR